MTETQPPTAELPEDPSNRELLDRIIKLEADNVRLRAQVDDLGNAFVRYIDSEALTTKQIWDFIWALVDKVFPQYREMQSKMDAIVPPCYVDPNIDRRASEE